MRKSSILKTLVVEIPHSQLCLSLHNCYWLSSKKFVWRYKLQRFINKKARRARSSPPSSWRHQEQWRHSRWNNTIDTDKEILSRARRTAAAVQARQPTIFQILFDKKETGSKRRLIFYLYRYRGFPVVREKTNSFSRYSSYYNQKDSPEFEPYSNHCWKKIKNIVCNWREDLPVLQIRLQSLVLLIF